MDLEKKKETQKAIVKFLERISIPVIIDAEALIPEILTIKQKKNRDWILTPHPKEFERTFQTEFSIKQLKQSAQKYDLTILAKGPIDTICTKNNCYENETGCVQMRVGGTGDVLAGIVASYRAQGLTSLQAAHSAAHYFGKAGEKLAQKQTTFTAKSLAKFYPQSLL